MRRETVIYCDKEEFNDCKQKLFFYKSEVSPMPGYNLRITVFMIRRSDGMPKRLGYADRNTAGYKGSEGTACDVISEVFNYKRKDGYHFDRKDVHIWEV